MELSDILENAEDQDIGATLHLSAGTTYYVISSGLTANAFQVAATVGGAAIVTTGTQSGVHTATSVPSGSERLFVAKVMSASEQLDSANNVAKLAAKRAAEAVRRAGAAATDEERKQIVALTEQLAKEEQAHRQAKEAADFFKETAYDSFSELIPQIETGNAALDRFVNTMIEAVAQAALLGSGPLAGIFGAAGGGGLLGAILPGFAKGTPSAPGGPAWVGEDGPEIVNLPRGAEVVPNNRIAQHMGAGSQKMAIDVSVGWSRTADGQLKPYVESVSQKAVQTAAPGIVGASVKRSKDQILPTISSYQRSKTGGDYRNG